MPINLDIIRNRLEELREQEYANKPRKRTKPEVFTQKQIEEEIFVNDALYFDLHREHSYEFADLMMNGWPEDLSKDNLRRQNRYIRARISDIDRYVIRG